MATELRLRGGTTAQHASFTGATKEITVDTTKNTVVVHDGSTAGGIPLAIESNLTTEVNNSVHAPGTGLPNEAGTAYASDVTTSTTDTTAGRLLKVRDFGVGGQVVPMPLDSDFNSFTVGGIYGNSSGSVINSPSAGILRVGAYSTDRMSQIHHGIVDNTLRIRSAVGVDNWTPWQEIYHTGNLFTSTTAPGNAPLYACRAWVNFNGTNTVAIRASGNVSSITDNGTGLYTVNFTTAMPDSNYAVSCTSAQGVTNNLFNLSIDTGTNSSLAPAALKTTTAVRVRNRSSSGSQGDPEEANVIIFR